MVGASVDVVGYFDFGSGTGAAPTAFAEGLAERKRLGRAVCRGVSGEDDDSIPVRSAFPLGRRLPQMVGVLGGVVPGVEPRLFMERAFDRLVERRLRSGTLNADIHYHHTPGHLKSLRAANDRGMQTVLAGAVELTERSIRRYERECEKHGLDCQVPTELRRAATRRLRTLQECDQIVAMSSFAADSYVDGGIDPDCIGIVPLGVDTDRFSPSPQPDDGTFRVTFVGTVNVLKGIPYLLEAWELAGLANDSEAELRLCGHVTDEVEPLIENAPENVTTPGFVDPVPEYQRASVFVLPSLSEGFAKTPLEAMSSGCPVLVTENAGTPDIIENGTEGLVVPEADSKALATALDRLRAESDERDRMGNAARTTAENHTWDRYVTDLLSAIESF
jgi:glycosyltransferase involved in cell wall biosynthesis